MKKHTYQATDVKKVSLDRLAELTEDKRIVIGVDVAKTNFFACLMGEDRGILAIIKWKHPDCTREFVELLLSLPTAGLVAALEPSGTYGDCLRHLLNNRGVKVYLISAKRSHDAAEVYDGVPSVHDAKSASVIARLYLDGGGRLWEEKSEDSRNLAATISLMDALDKVYHGWLNRLEALFARHWPEATRIIDLTTKSLLTLVSEIGGPARVAADPARSRRLLRKVGGNLLAGEKIDRLVGSASETLGLPLGEEELGVFQRMCGLALEAGRKAERARKAVVGLGGKKAPIEALGRVVGRATAAVIVAGVGDPADFGCASAFEKAAGLNIKERSSGKHQGQRKITKRGSARARRWLYLAALRLTQSDPLVRAWYQRKIARDGGVKMKALTALMRKLIKALWHVGQGEEFDSRKLFDARRLAAAG